MYFDIPAIKVALPIEAVLEARGHALRRGRGPCPICGTSSLSQAFSVRGARWRCFACNESGDVIDLVQRLDGLTRRQAIERCAGAIGLSPGRQGPLASIPKSPEQLEREQRLAAWRRYAQRRSEREVLSALAMAAGRRRGFDHPLTQAYGQLLADEWTEELLAEHEYVCSLEKDSA